MSERNATNSEKQSRDDGMWFGEELLNVDTGVALVTDERLIQWDASERDGDHYEAFVCHSGGKVSLSTAYKHDEMDLGAMVNLEPDEARRLAALLEEAADYQESDASKNNRPQSRSMLNQMKEVLFG